MAQGQIKKASTPAKSQSRTNAGVTKKGLGDKNPKKSKLIKAKKINKKFTAGLTAQTEKMLAQRAGHVEMIGKSGKKSGDAKGIHGKKGGEKRTGRNG